MPFLFQWVEEVLDSLCKNVTVALVANSHFRQQVGFGADRQWVTMLPRAMMNATLERKGYDVVAAASVTEALRRPQHDGSAFG